MKKQIIICMEKSLECHIKINFNPSIVKLSWKFSSSINFKQKLLFNENVCYFHILHIFHEILLRTKLQQHKTYNIHLLCIANMIVIAKFNNSAECAWVCMTLTL